LYKHRKKCYDHPNKYLGLIIDGMDQKKTLLPHFVRTPKKLQEENFIQFHLVGCMVFNEKMFPRVFFTTPNIHNDANLTITIIHDVVTHWSGILPEVLYLQLDNTSRENKNQVLFGYLNMLVELGIFKKIKVGFLLVGHTHDHIDQMFSRFSVTLRRKGVGSLPSLIECIKKSYIPEPVFHVLEETIDMRRFIFGSHGEEKCIEQLNDISFQHQFRIKKIDGITLIWGKKYSTIEEWGPSSGLAFLKFIPERPMFSSKILLLQSVSELHNARRQKREINYFECLEEIKRCIRDTYEYFDVADSVWWESFFSNQSDMISRSINGDTLLKTPFFLPQNMPNEHEHQETHNVEQQQPQAIINSPQVEEREIYIGSRRSRAQREAMEDLYRGSVQDLKEGCMIAVLADEDPLGYPFWIAKVIKVINENEEITAVDVHWYATSTHPFNGVYKPEMVVEKRIGRKRKRKGANINRRHTDVLKLEDVDILVYDFNLTKRGTLRLQTINILKKLLPEQLLLKWDSAECRRRSTRLLNSEMVGMHVDSDGALVDEREEYGSSSSASSHSSEDVDYDGVPEPMADFE